ncbi:hypothetical protein [Apibacter sp. wkB309]|uniref:hypothetical protein n=1 Tax=Apibacter sp. wkB309 TaxID=1679467 RepID=UPI000CF984BF|nr:hypothetical protein [Apibacter sp. wkB309]PQL89834.1 hypothetical protein C4S75_07535 [Apibacter sp. wkB309]
MNEKELLKIMLYLNKKGTISNEKFNWLKNNNTVILELLIFSMGYYEKVLSKNQNFNFHDWKLLDTSKMCCYFLKNSFKNLN